MIDPKYLDILRAIVWCLAGQAIDWAVTGSCGFALQGLDVDVHDIDLQTDRDGAYAIERAFADKSTRKVVFSESERIRSHFGALEIGGVVVEIMGDLQKRLDDGAWEPPVDIRPHRRRVAIEGMDIPVLSLEYEQRAYLGLGRLRQAEMLRTWLQEHGDADRRPRPE
jgi:Aminoglycoside-2''-adenylyltransferase